MQQPVRDLVQSIHDAPGRLVLVTAGAGTQALAWLLGVAGASRTLLEALIPYDWAAFNDFLDQAPEQYVAPETARLMAGRALTRARWLHREETVMGLACTATIATDRPKRGAHRAHIATWQPQKVRTHSLFLEKGARDRQGEEEMVSRLILNALASAYDLDASLALDLGRGDRLETETVDLRGGLHSLYEDREAHLLIPSDGQATSDGTLPGLLLSGSFNPLHEGHLQLAKAAQARTGDSLAFELSVRNVDKPPLPLEEGLSRLAQFAGRWPAVASNAPTFVEKARLFPGVTFVVGYDTAVRIVDPRYYGNDPQQMRAALLEISAHGCDFLVAGRVDDDSAFHTEADLQLPAELDALFRPLPGFRHDISSTELRQSGERGSR